MKKNDEFNDLGEVKEAMMRFITDVCADFPYAGSIMKDFVPRMKTDISLFLSEELLSSLDASILSVMNSEAVDNLESRDFRVMIDLAGEYIRRCNGSGGGDVIFARSVRDHLKLELRACNIDNKNDRIKEQIKRTFGGIKNELDVDPDVMHSIIKEYISLKKGVRQKRAKRRDENLKTAMKIDKAHNIRKRFEKLEKEKQRVVGSINENSPTVTEKYNFLNIIAKERIGELNRCCADYGQVKMKKEIESIRQKIRHIYLVIEKANEWISLKRKAERFFEKNMDNEIMIPEIDSNMILHSAMQAG